jgi:hypothetical protein
MQNREKAFALFIDLVDEFRRSDPGASEQFWKSWSKVI